MALALVGIHITRASDGSLADATIVVYNRDLSESAQLARFYAEKRGIARNHLVPLACSPEEEISREEYDRTIAEPLRAIFEQRHWWTILSSVAAMSGCIVSGWSPSTKYGV